MPPSTCPGDRWTVGFIINPPDLLQKIGRAEDDDERGRWWWLWWVEEEEDLRVEAIIDSADCPPGNNRSSVVYSWLLVYDSDRSTLFTSDRRWLSVSTNKLPIGNHTLHLKVGINGSIVYATIKAGFTVVPRPFRVGNIDGSRRWIGRLDNVTITAVVGRNASRKCGKCVLEWNCSVLNRPESKCFLNDSSSSLLLKRNQFETFFMASWLNQKQFKEFVFTLHVTKDHRTMSASQIIQLNLDEPSSIQIGVWCSTCFEKGLVSNNERNIFSTYCFNCSTTVQFEWQLWLVLDDKQTLPISWSKCVQPDGSTFYLHDKKVETVAGTTANGVVSDIEDSASLINATLISRPHGKHYYNANGSNRHSRFLNRSANIYLDHPMEGRLNITEGLPGEAGSAPGRPNRFQSDVINRYGIQQNRLLNRNRLISRVDLSQNYHQHRKHAKTDQQMSYQMQLIPLLKHETTTGLFENQLIIQPNILKAGRTYKVVVKSRDKVGERWLYGRSELVISSVIGPHKGRCNITPNHGLTYWTRFRLSCLEWVGSNEDHHPFLYEMRYSISPDDSSGGTLIRLGMNNNLKFYLPPGLPQEDYKVYLNIIIYERGGGSTRVCNVTKRVFPISDRHISALLRTLNKRSSDLQTYLNRDDFPSLLQKLHVVTVIANDWFRKVNGSQVEGWNFNRIVLRYLTLVNGVTEEEILLSLNIITVIFQIKIDERTLNRAFATIRQLTNTWLNVGFRSNMLLEGLKVLSKMTNAAMKFSPERYRLKFMQLLETVVRRRLEMLQPSEFPLEIETNSFILSSVCRMINNGAVYLETKWINLHLSVHNILGVHYSEPVCMITKTYFGSILELPNLTLGLFLANGSLLPFHGMELHRPIKTVIPRSINEKKLQYVNGLLTPYFMDTYNFQLSKSDLYQTLMLRINFDSAELDLFPIKLYLSYGELPCVENCLYTKSLTSYTDELTIFIPDSHFNRTGMYFIGIVSENYLLKNFKFTGDNATMSYSLRTEFIACLQKQMSAKRWRNDHTSNVLYGTIADDRMIYCRFDKLSDYSATLYQVKLSFSRISVEIFLRKPINPWILSALTVIILISTAIRWIYYRLNSKTRHFCGVRFAENNSIDDEFGYLIQLQTGYELKAGTTAKLCIVLYGEEGISETRVLVSSGESRIVIEPGTNSSFLLTTKEKLGLVYKIRLWHDNSGISPSCFIRHIIITDIRAGNGRYFECNRWLSIDENNGKIELFAKAQPVLVSKELFKDTFSKFYHKMSVWNCLWSDHFTSVERFFGCLLVAVTSFWSIFIWKYLLISDELDSNVERLELSWKSVFKSIVIGFVVYGVATVYALFLQFTKLPSCIDGQNYINRYLAESDVSLNYDQPVRRWSKLQNWAERQGMRTFSGSMTTSSVSQMTNFNVSVETIYHFLEGDGLDFQVDKFSGVSKVKPSYLFILPVWCRYFARILCLSYIGGSIICTFYFSARFSTEEFIAVLQVVIMSTAFGYIIVYPILVGFISVISLMLEMRKISHISAGCVCELTCVDKSETKSSTNTIDVPLTDTELANLKTKIVKNRKAYSYLKRFMSQIFVVILLSILVTGERNNGEIDINRALQKRFQRQYSINRIKSHEDWLNCLTWMISDLPQPLTRNNDNAIWFAKGYDSIIVSDFLFLTRANISTCLILPRKTENATNLRKQFNEINWTAQEFISSEFHFCLYNIPAAYLSIIKIRVEFFNDVIASWKINVESFILYNQGKIRSIFELIASVCKVLTICFALNNLNTLIIQLIFNLKKRTCGLLLVLRNVIFSCSLLFYVFLNAYISCIVHTQTAAIESRNADINEIESAFKFININRSFIGIIYFINMLFCVDFMHIYWSSTITKTFIAIKRVWKVLLCSIILFVMVMIAFTSLAVFWGSTKSSSFHSPAETIYCLFAVVTRHANFNPRLPIQRLPFDCKYITAYVVVLTLIGYRQIKALIASMKNNIESTSIPNTDVEQNTDLDITSVIKVIKLGIRRLFHWKDSETVDIPMKTVPLACTVSLIESKMHELLKRLEQLGEFDSFEEMAYEAFDDNEIETEESNPNTSTSSPGSDSTFTNTPIDTDNLSNHSECLPWVFQPLCQLDSPPTITQNGLRRTRTQGKGIYPNDLELCHFDGL